MPAKPASVAERRHPASHSSESSNQDERTADKAVVPPGINLPKSALVLVAVSSSLLGLVAGFFILAFLDAGDPDVTIRAHTVYVSVIVPFGVAAFTSWLLRKEGPRLRAAGRDPRTAVTTLLWLANIALAALLALYLADDAEFSQALYRGRLIDQTILKALMEVSFAAVFVAIWAIAYSVRARFALIGLGLLIGAAYLSELTSVWLGL